MQANLESTRSEIQKYLESHDFVVFHSDLREPELPNGAVYWNLDSHPDFRGFLAAAATLGVRMINLFAREFDGDAVELLQERLAQSSLARDERRELEAPLRDMRAMHGFVCRIELSFDHSGRTYIFDLRTEWLDVFEDLFERISELDEDEPPLSGLYSNN